VTCTSKPAPQQSASTAIDNLTQVGDRLDPALSSTRPDFIQTVLADGVRRPTTTSRHLTARRMPGDDQRGLRRCSALLRNGPFSHLSRSDCKRLSKRRQRKSIRSSMPRQACGTWSKMAGSGSSHWIRKAHNHRGEARVEFGKPAKPLIRVNPRQGNRWSPPSKPRKSQATRGASWPTRPAARQVCCANLPSTS